MGNQLLGVVVCGGQSKRMGRDKGLIEKDGQTWAQLALERLQTLQIQVVLSINETQLEKYAAIFDRSMLIVDNQNVGGPMNGLLSVHSAYPNGDLLLLACDMIEMKQEILHGLAKAYTSNGGHDYYAYEVEGVLQPFCAIYSANALKELMQKHVQDELGTSSPRYVLEHGNTYKLHTEISSPFTNYNTLDERNT